MFETSPDSVRYGVTTVRSPDASYNCARLEERWGSPRYSDWRCRRLSKDYKHLP